MMINAVGRAGKKPPKNNNHVLCMQSEPPPPGAPVRAQSHSYTRPNLPLAGNRFFFFPFYHRSRLSLPHSQSLGDPHGSQRASVHEPISSSTSPHGYSGPAEPSPPPIPSSSSFFFFFFPNRAQPSTMLSSSRAKAEIKAHTDSAPLPQFISAPV